MAKPRNQKTPIRVCTCGAQMKITTGGGTSPFTASCPECKRWFPVWSVGDVLYKAVKGVDYNREKTFL